MSNGSWTSVFDIARIRELTKQGKEKLTKHEIDVLMDFVNEEANEAMRAAMGGFFGYFLGAED